ncbi:uncharacterized protein LOC132281021 [Cornus florida]|uniref:uncharacterized protein LOC132281021 n=1 Tax=Cornus florida TaxID=4283 RepID=UPI002897C3EC|nr:uncharacterized protein LOC132281021 [Cornus florida]
MIDVETWYSKAEKIILALVYAKRKLRHNFESHSIKVLTNYPMRVILFKPDLSRRITKWAIELSSIDISYEPKVSHKGQTLVDFLLEYEDKPEEPGPSKPQWELRVDGSSSLISAGAGVIITTPEGTKLQQSIRLTFLATNNEAEYEDLLAGLRLANQLQVTGQYQPKEDRMKAYREAMESASRRFNQIEFHQIPREENSEEDQLAATASSSDEDLVRIVPIDILDEPSKIPRQEIMVIPNVPHEPCWMDPLEAYLKKGTPRTRRPRRRNLGSPQPNMLSSITNYTESHSQIHDGDCSNHSRGRSLAHKIPTQGYFWPYLARNAEEYARSSLPKIVEKKEYVLLATDYFTKWVEAEAYSSVTHEQVKSFLWNNIICRFGVPNVIMMDNSLNSDN